MEPWDAFDDILDRELRIVEKFKEIKYNDGLILIEYVIKNDFDKYMMNDILKNLAINKNKNIHHIYEDIVKKTYINYYTMIFDQSYLTEASLVFIHICALHGNICLLSHLLKKVFQLI